VRLTLPTGQDLRVRVLGPDGKPVVDQPVELELGFSQEKGYDFSTRLERRTGPDGIARFEKLASDTSLSPLTLALHVTVPPVRFQGYQVTLTGRELMEIKLRHGLSASGVVVEAGSSKSIPGAEIRLIPREYGRATFRGQIHTKTDSLGAFRFEGLENLEYVAYIDGSVPKGTIVKRDGTGTRFEYPDGVERARLRPGRDDLRWEVQLYPGSSLKTAD
jgi:hypothetical protein